MGGDVLGGVVVCWVAGGVGYVLVRDRGGVVGGVGEVCGWWGGVVLGGWCAGQGLCEVVVCWVGGGGVGYVLVRGGVGGVVVIWVGGGAVVVC